MMLKQLAAGRGRWRVLRVAVVSAVVAGAGWFSAQERAPVSAVSTLSTAGVVGAEAAGALNPRLVVVLPFRVEGEDSAFGYLREGMVDLLALKVTGARYAVDARTTLAAWQTGTSAGADTTLAAATRIATQVRARMMLVGTVTGVFDGITVSASLIDVASGEEVAMGSASGPVDELPALLDRLIAAVLSQQLGGATERMDVLTSASVPALRAYLEGTAYYRRGEYEPAVESYATALEEDSTFALAALGVVEAAAMAPDLADGEWQTRGLQVLHAHLDRLPARERAYASARWPAEPATTVAAQLEHFERVAEQFPDHPETWYHFADALYRRGALTGSDDYMQRARAGYARALALDSTYRAALEQLLLVAGHMGDTTFVFGFGERRLAAEPDGFTFEYRLRAAHWRGETGALHRMHAGLDSLDMHRLVALAVEHQHTPGPFYRLDYARRAADLLQVLAEGAADRNNARLYRYQIEMNAGRPRAALALLDSVPPKDPLAWDRRRIYDAVYWDGDSVAAAASAQRVERHLRRVGRGPLTDLDATALCALTTLHLTQGDTNGAEAAIARLRVAHPSSKSPMGRQLCALTLAAVLAHLQNAPDAEERLVELDSVLQTGPLVAGFREQANITAARLFEARGDVHHALAASRRRLHEPGGQSYASTFFELECRLAALDRDRDAAVRACSQYLALRSDPEPRRAEAAERARAELQRNH